MNQFLVIIRGAPASGKTTISKELRNFDNKIVWLKVDNFKDFFSGDSRPEHQKYVDLCALASLRHLLDEGFSVVMEKIFYDPLIIPLAVKEAEKRGIVNKVFQIRCALQTLQERDKVRPGVKEGCRKPLGNAVIKDLYDKLEETYFPGAVSLDTENLSIQECVEIVRKEVDSRTPV